MRNRAKCKLCKDIVESMHPTDSVMCQCGEIEVYGGDAMRCRFGDVGNFLRVDDEGNEIIVREKNVDISSSKVDREGLLRMLDDMIENVERLPEHAKITPINHYDFCGLMMLLRSILRV